MEGIVFELGIIAAALVIIGMHLSHIADKLK